MNSKLRDFAALAEIIGAVAIVISLVFVGLQIRANTRAAYASTYDELIAEQANWRFELASQPRLVELIAAVDSGEALGETDFQIARFAQEGVIKVYERAYFARYYGRLGDDEWLTFAGPMCDLRRRIELFEIPRTIFAPAFWEYLYQLDC